MPECPPFRFCSLSVLSLWYLHRAIMPHAAGHDGPGVPGLFASGRDGTSISARHEQQLGDVLLSGDLITVYFRRFKHSAKQGPQSLQVKGGCITGTLISPAAFLHDFQKARGNVQAAFFAYPDGSPILRRDFDDSLKQLLAFCGHPMRLRNI